MSSATDTVKIERAQPADEAFIRGLLQRADLPAEDFAAHLPHFLVARHEAVVVGSVGFERHGEDALLRSLAVAPAWRGHGLGAALVRRLETEAGSAGVRQLYLLTTTAEAFFARRSFRPVLRDQVPSAVAATPEFQSLCPASAVCLTRTLPS